MKPKRSLNVCFFSHSAELAGAERTLLELVTELIKDYGVVCTVVLPKDGPLKERLEQIGAATRLIDYSWWYDQAILTDEKVKELCLNSAKNLLYNLKQVLRRINPDIVFTNTMSIPWGAMAASFLQKPHVWFVHEFGEADHGLKTFLPLNDTLKVIKNFSSAILTNSEAVRKALFPDLGKNKVKTCYQYINIPERTLSQKEKKYFSGKNSTKLIISGTVHEGKAQKDVILAAEELVRRGRDVEFIIMGRCAGKYAERLKALIKQEKLKKHVNFIGFKENPYPIMNQADIVLTCSRKEAFGRVTVEAMLLKKPVIATNRGGTLELIKSGFNGLLYEPGDYNQLADKIEHLITNPNKTSQLAENGYRFAKKTFTKDNFGGKIYRLLLSLKPQKSPEAPFSNLSLEGPALLDAFLTAANNKNPKIAALITELGIFLNSLDSQIQEKDSQIQEKDSQIQEKDSQIQEKDSQIQEKDSQIQEKDSQIHSLEFQIQQVQQSVLIQLANRYHKVMEKILPLSTRRRHYYELILTIVRLHLGKGKTTSKQQSVFLLELNSPMTEIESLTRPNNKKIQAHSFQRINKDIAICTVIAKNYLPFAQSLINSFKKYHPDINIFVLLADNLDGYFKPEEEKFTLVNLAQLNIPDLERLCFQYSPTELCTAVKPYFFNYLLERYKLKKLVFFDPDILILHNLSSLFALLDAYSIILTPHTTAPVDEDGFKPNELSFLQAGIYNLGFIAMANNEVTRQFLVWWQTRLYDKCRLAHTQGMHVDQKWIDFVPAFYDGVNILKEPGYNVAYFNLHSRRIEIKDGSVYVNNKPCYFFHFTGFDPRNIKQVSKHQDRFTINKIGQAKTLFQYYQKLLLANGYEECKNWPYAFDYFDNGIKIPDATRKLYLRLGEKVKKFGNPFSTTHSTSYFRYLNEFIDGDSASGRITRLWYEIYQMRPDVQRAYPDILGRDRDGFIGWILNTGRVEHDIDKAFIPPQLIIPRPKKAISFNLLKTIFVRRLYIKIVHPLEPRLGSVLRAILGRNEAIWAQLQKIRSRLIYGFDQYEITPEGDVVDLPRKPFGVNIAGYITSEKGTGEAARANIRSLNTTNIPYVLNNIIDIPGSANTDTSYKEFSQENPYLINLIHVNADQVPYFVEHRGQSYLNNHYNIGFWNWELSDFPQEWLSSFQYFNEILVPSSFVQDAIARVAPITVTRVPYALAENLQLLDLTRSHFDLSEDDFIFLFVFDFYSYSARKNPMGAIQAFRKAFTKKDKACLVLKCSHSESFSADFSQLQKAAQNANIRIIDGVLNRNEINTLIYLSDCLVSLHRSEGFGLLIAEAMRLGKPVIATGYSGNMDFMNVNNSFPVKYRLIPMGENEYPPFKKGYVWAEPDIMHAAKLMRFVYKNRQIATKIGQQASEDIKRQLNPVYIGSIIATRLKRISK